MLDIVGEDRDVEEQWRDFKETYDTAAAEILGRQKTLKEERISDESWNLIEEMNELQ